MQAEAERTLNNLNVLAALSHNDKLLTNDDCFNIHAPTTFRAMYRFWSGERRGTNVTRIRNCIRSAIEFVKSSLEEVTAVSTMEGGQVSLDVNKLRLETTAVQHFRMVNALSKCRGGIGNLLQTYRDDPALASQIQCLVEEITDFLKVLDSHSQTLKSRFSWISEQEENIRRIPTP